MLNEGAVSLCPDVVALLCANIYLLAGDYESTLRITNSASSLECSALAGTWLHIPVISVEAIIKK